MAIPRTVTPSLRERRKLLRTFRKQYRLTLVDLGKLAEVSQPMLSQFERGDRDLSPEAWSRVLQAMQKLLHEDEGRRREERAKASETAAKLGVKNPLLEAAFPLGLPEDTKDFFRGILRIGEEFANEAELEAEGQRLQKVNELGQLLGSAVEKNVEELEAEVLKNPTQLAALVQDWKEKTRAIAEFNRRRAELMAQGYVMMPKAVEEERDQLQAHVAELEQELKAYQELVSQLTTKVAELEEENRQAKSG